MNLPKAELSRKEALQLWTSEKSDYAKEQMILSNIGLIGIVMKRCGLQTSDDDMFSTGIIGLIKSINTFDEGKGIAFSTYASTCIQNEILMTFRKREVPIAIYLDDSIKSLDGEDVFYKDTIADSFDLEGNSVNKIFIYNTLEKMSERDRGIIRLYFGIGCKKLSQVEVSKKYKISQAQVSRIIRKARACA